MKTHASKTNESQQLTNVMFVASFILIVVIMVLISNYTKSDFWDSSLKFQKNYSGFINHITPPDNQFIIPVNSKSKESSTENLSMKLMIPLNEFYFTNQVDRNLEKDKLIERNNDRLYLSLNDEKKLIEDSENDTQNSELNLLMEKLYEYLIPAEEPELEFVMLFTAEEPQHIRKYYKNEYLENLVKIKVEESEKFYANQQKLKEYLVVEKELPLQIEEWMIDDNCWCFENKSALASSEEIEKY